jgi:hypothetical protein
MPSTPFTWGRAIIASESSVLSAREIILVPLFAALSVLLFYL